MLLWQACALTKELENTLDACVIKSRKFGKTQTKDSIPKLPLETNDTLSSVSPDIESNVGMVRLVDCSGSTV